MKTFLTVLFISILQSTSVASALSDSTALIKPSEWKEMIIPTWNNKMDYVDVNGAFDSTAATDWSDNLVWVPSKKEVLYLNFAS